MNRRFTTLGSGTRSMAQRTESRRFEVGFDAHLSDGDPNKLKLLKICGSSGCRVAVKRLPHWRHFTLRCVHRGLRVWRAIPRRLLASLGNCGYTAADPELFGMVRRLINRQPPVPQYRFGVNGHPEFYYDANNVNYCGVVQILTLTARRARGVVRAPRGCLSSVQSILTVAFSTLKVSRSCVAGLGGCTCSDNVALVLEPERIQLLLAMTKLGDPAFLITAVCRPTLSSSSSCSLNLQLNRENDRLGA